MASFSAFDRVRLLRAREGPRAVLGAMARRGLRPLVAWHSMLFFERDLTKGPGPEICATIPLDVRLVETPDDVRRLEDSFAQIGRRREDVGERLGRGDRCFIAVAQGRLIHFSWLSPGPVACAEICATLRLDHGELFQGDSFTDRFMRGHAVTGAVMTAIIRWEQEHGYLRHYFYIARDNHSNLGTLGKVREQRPVLTRTVCCYRLPGSSGVLVTGLDGPARPTLEVAAGLRSRRLGRLGHWVHEPRRS